MRVLVLDEWLPLPANSGKRIRTYNLLAPLTRKHEIFYLCFADPEREAGEITSMRDAGFEVVAVAPLNRYCSRVSLAIGATANLLSACPLVVRKHYDKSFMQKLTRMRREKRFDVLHCEWTPYATYLRGITDTPMFLSSHNVECVSWQRSWRTDSNPLRRAVLWLESVKMKSFERSAVTQFDHVAAVSPEDASRFRSWYGVKSVEVIPNGVDCRHYEAEPRREQPDLIAYCGSMDATVNQDAVHYFVRAMLPRIRAVCPSVRFMVIGSRPPPSIQALAGSHVLVSGTIDDVRPLLSRAAISVVPLRIGSGSRLKILESFAAGVPVVSTTVGAEGLPVQHGHHLAIADHPQAFADACLDLLGNAAQRRRFVENGRALVRRCFDWSSLSPMIERAWEHAISRFYEGRRAALVQSGGATCQCT